MEQFFNKSKEQLIEEIISLKAELQLQKETNTNANFLDQNQTTNEKYAEIESQQRLINKQLKKIQKSKAILEKSHKELNIKNNELKKAQEKLIHSEKMASLGVLTAGIAHEINNPINFISMGISCLREDLDDIISLIELINKLNADNHIEIFNKFEELKEEIAFEDTANVISQTIEHIDTGIQRTLQVVKGLQKYSHADTEEPSKTDIHDCIDTALILFNSKFKEKIRIMKQYDENLPQITCYPGKLGQVFVNIVSNAIDAITKLGIITIKTQTYKKFIKISISDTGEGMTEETKEKLFEPFYTTKTLGKGTGLGLSISSEIIKNHNGTIEVNSSPGKGTEFIISIPL